MFNNSIVTKSSPILETSKTTGKLIYVVIDDTISEKTVPSSKAKKPTEKCGFHNSHLKGKTVYGHQLVTVMFYVIVGIAVKRYLIFPQKQTTPILKD